MVEIWTSCYRRYEVVAVDINKLRDLSEWSLLILDTKIQVPVLATFLDGELGIRYRGYSIDLAAKGHFLEVSYLLFLVSCQLWRN
jgi:hypothetical protein